MRTSLAELQQLDDYVQGTAQPQDALLFQAKLIINPALQQDVCLHKQTLTVVNAYGRKQLRAVISDVHHQLFTQPKHQSFRQKILSIFKNR